MFAFTKTRNMWVILSICQPKCPYLLSICYKWFIRVCDVDNTINKLSGFVGGTISLISFTQINSLVFSWIPQNSFDNKSTLVQVMAWSRQATSNYPSQINSLAFSWIPQNSFDKKSTLVQVIALCPRATSHYLSPWWPLSMTSYCVTRPQWVDVYMHVFGWCNRMLD